MAKGRRERRILVVTGAAAFVAVGLKLLVSAIKAHKQRRRKMPDVPGSRVLVNLSASEIQRLTDQIIAKSKEVYDLVASVPLEKVSYTNVIAPLAELEAYQFSSVQSCVFPKMVSTSNDICKASAEAESRLNLHFLTCRKREDVYRVTKAFADRGEWLGYEAKRYTQCLVKEFERNGVNLTPSKKKELENLGARIEELSLQYAQNLSMDNSFLLLGESEIAGMPLHAMASSSVAALFLGVILALLCASSYARPGGPFHPCNTLSITYTFSSSSAATAAVPHRAYRFVSIYRIITPFSSSSSANAFDDRRPLLIRRPGLPRREVAEPAALGFSSLHERAKDILVVVVGLLFGVGCGALTAATMYLVWSLVANRNEVYGSDGEEGDYAVESPKKAGYVKIPSAEPAPAIEGYEGN